ncbi:ATP-binding protein [Flavobacterium dankookense]|uniref:ATPase family protein associated with various cellular activities (AAA) n=1 Tax=Flavobacterium dankookense TaxID=706186 RepID=A0A4R6QHU2_9FLAO|nr:ATP-binding protein [Flavobacterium dankookense]TDP61169.1 ATPase family protein associated with various cellular activities (AAA) [Flavobacterium dankookense]
METKKLTILKAIEKVHATSKDTKLKIDQYEVVKDEIKVVENYFKVNEIQAIILSSFLSLSCIDEIELIEVIKYFNLEKIEFLQYTLDINLLVNKNILLRKEHHRMAAEDYHTNPELLKFIISNNPIPECLIEIPAKEDSFIEFLGDLDKLSKQKDNREIEYHFFLYNLRNLIEDYSKYKLVNFAQENLKLIDSFVFFDVIIDVIAAGENNFRSSLQGTVDDFTNRNRDSYQYISDFLEGKTKLNQLDLVEKNKTQFGDKHKIQLTQKALKMLEELEGIKIGFKENKSEKLLYPDKIQKTKLFYNSSEQVQLNTILKSMSHKSFTNLQKRLSNSNLPIGMTSLLYGAPGTGKTESVYQIAKQFNRPVFKVEISETKSMWFGESQKLIKKVFTDYYEIKDREKICPILLFNEADAIIGKRKAAGSSSVADTENAIQNILLEELEDFNGILFATSNLVDNIDAAFERRFLFKIKFEKPSNENAAKIWKSKIPILSNKQAISLATNFNFSGGEMENISRKCIMEDAVLGSTVSFDQIYYFCENEKWGNNNLTNKIGF